MPIFENSDGFEFVAKLTAVGSLWTIECLLRECVDPEAPDCVRYVESVAEIPSPTGYEGCRKLARDIAHISGYDRSEIIWERTTE